MNCKPRRSRLRRSLSWQCHASRNHLGSRIPQRVCDGPERGKALRFQPVLVRTGVLARLVERIRCILRDDDAIRRADVPGMNHRQFRTNCRITRRTRLKWPPETAAKSRVPRTWFRAKVWSMAAARSRGHAYRGTSYVHHLAVDPDRRKVGREKVGVLRLGAEPPLVPVAKAGRSRTLREPVIPMATNLPLTQQPTQQTHQLKSLLTWGSRTSCWPGPALGAGSRRRARHQPIARKRRCRPWTASALCSGS